MSRTHRERDIIQEARAIAPLHNQYPKDTVLGDHLRMMRDFVLEMDQGTDTVEWIPISLNQRVRVKLTPTGLDIYNSYIVKLCKALNVSFASCISEDMWLEVQMWSLMQIFGPSVGQGCSPPFVDMIIQVEPMSSE